MKPETAEWVSKAEGDWHTMHRERAAPLDPNYDAVCYHAQQCAEKYLKARLVEASAPFRRTHDLEALLDLVLAFEQDCARLREGVVDLTDIGVEVRYPGLTADAEDADMAIGVAENVREAMRAGLGLG